MNTPKAIVILSFLAVAIIGGLLYLAIVGNVWAAGILFSGWSILCLITGWSLSMIQQGKAAAQEQQTFMSNAKENLAIMGALQSVQNKQNQSLMQQLGQVSRLPQVGPDLSASLLIDDGIFEELEQ